jgi:hypothetical protein
MNSGRLALASVGGTVAYFAAGSAIFLLAPQMIDEARKYSAVFRSGEEQMARMPAMMVATLAAILVLAVLYALAYRGGSGLVAGTRFGALVGAFVVFAFVVHNYVNLNFGPTLMLMQGNAYFVEWTVVGTVIGLLYRPLETGRPSPYQVRTCRCHRVRRYTLIIPCDRWLDSLFSCSSWRAPVTVMRRSRLRRPGREHPHRSGARRGVRLPMEWSTRRSGWIGIGR